jgi:dipeptidyl aminopeptidase/acylaminoacyl peptidase
MMVTPLVVESARKTAELVVYPGEYHAFGTPSYKKDLDERYLAWYGKYVEGIEASAITGS